MTLEQIHKWILFVCDKEMSGWFPPEEIDENLDRAQMDLFNSFRKDYAINQIYQDALAPFKVEYTFTNAKTPEGLITFPQNYQSFLGAYKQTILDGKIKRFQIDIVNDDELAERLDSALRPVTVNQPVGQWYGRGQIQLWPKKPNSGVAFYLRRPQAPQFVYSMEGRTVVYNDIESVELEWDDTCIQKIMIKALEYLGVHLDDDKLIQYTKS